MLRWCAANGSPRARVWVTAQTGRPCASMILGRRDGRRSEGIVTILVRARVARILVVDDVEENRDVVEGLLTADGYRIDAARTEGDAVETAYRRGPDLILVSLGGLSEAVIASAKRIRQRAALGSGIPIVVFCMPTVDEGAEVDIGENVYLTRPDNFNQLRGFLGRLLRA